MNKENYNRMLDRLKMTFYRLRSLYQDQEFDLTDWMSHKIISHRSNIVTNTTAYNYVLEIILTLTF